MFQNISNIILENFEKYFRKINENYNNWMVR